MRVEWDPKKYPKVKRKHNIDLKDLVIVFKEEGRILAYDIRDEEIYPDQYIVLAWSAKGLMCSIIIEERKDKLGSYVYIVTSWKTTKEEKKEYL